MATSLWEMLLLLELNLYICNHVGLGALCVSFLLYGSRTA